MVNQQKRKRIFRVAFIVVIIIMISLIFNKILNEWKGFRDIVSTITGALAPVVVGCVIAFLMNPILVFFDKVFRTFFQDRMIKDKQKCNKVSRIFSVIFTLVFLLGVITGILWMVIPQLYSSINQLIGNMDTYYNHANDAVDFVYAKLKKLNIPQDKVQHYVDLAFSKAQTWASKEVLPNLDKIVSSIGSGVVGGFKAIYNFLIGIVASLYIMANKEYLLARFKKIVYAIFGIEKGNLAMDGMTAVYKVFSLFINGKILDSFLIGLITYIVMTIVGMPYAILISAIIGVTNIIPFFGPIVGAVPCFFIVLIVDPLMSILLLFLILCIQQFDGNVLGPKILGDTIGISSFWVLAAVIVGGGLFGFMGMLLGVPVFTCLYMYINRVSTNSLIKKEMVYKTSDFENLKRMNEETGEPIYLTEEELDIRFKKKTPEEKAEIKKQKEEEKKQKKAKANKKSLKMTKINK